MKKLSLIIIASAGLLGAGCFQPLIVPQTAEPLSSNTSPNSGVEQVAGFGQLAPILSIPQSTQGTVKLNTDLPSLQKSVTVVRVPAGVLDPVQLQNLPDAMNYPSGLLGDYAKNLSLQMKWTNKQGLIWTYSSDEKQLEFIDPSNKPTQSSTNSWLSSQVLSDSVTNFFNAHGLSADNYRNIAIPTEWQTWINNLQASSSCMDEQSWSVITQKGSMPEIFNSPPPEITEATDCHPMIYPALIPVTIENVIDQRNIINFKGVPEPGGRILINALTGQPYAGWYTLPGTPDRSDYPAINEDQMRAKLLSGGIGGLEDGVTNVNQTYFAFVRLPKDDVSEPDYLVPALVGDGQVINGTSTKPYKIVVPLTQ